MYTVKSLFWRKYTNVLLMKFSLKIIKIFVCKQGKSLFQQMTLSDKKGKKLDCLTDYIYVKKTYTWRRNPASWANGLHNASTCYLLTNSLLGPSDTYMQDFFLPQGRQCSNEPSWHRPASLRACSTPHRPRMTVQCSLGLRSLPQQHLRPACPYSWPWAVWFPALISDMAYCHPSQCSSALPGALPACFQPWDCACGWGDGPTASWLPALESSTAPSAPDVLPSNSV